MTIRSKLLITVIPPIIIGIFILAYFSSSLVKSNIVSKHEELISLYSERLIQENIIRRSELLRTTGLYKVPSYVKSYKNEALLDLKKETSSSNTKVFILDENNKLQGDLSLPTFTTKEYWINEVKRLNTLNTKDRVNYLETENSSYFYLYQYYEPWNWHIIVFESDEEINEFIKEVEEVEFIAMLLIATLVSILIYFFTNRVILDSIYKLKTAVDHISTGDLEQKIEITSNDEISNVAKHFDEMRVRLKDRINLSNEQIKFRQLLIDSINIPIYIKDKNLEFITYNKAYTNLTGLDEKDSSLENLRLNDEFKKIEKEVFSKKDDVSKHLTVKSLEDKDIDIVLTNNLFYDNNNELAGLVGSIFDITQINEAKRRIERFNIELQQSVENKTKELKLSNKELEHNILELKQMQDELIESEKMASLGGLVAGVAHEINTPIGIGLTGITHFEDHLKTITEKYHSDNISEEEFEEFLTSSNTLANLIKINLTRTAHLVKSFKQISVDQSSEQEREFNIKDYLFEIITSLNSEIKKTDLKINIKCAENIVINSYPGVFSQIFTNLILNSKIHGYDEIKDGIINIDISIENNNLVIFYEDDGKGINNEYLSKIFDPFFTTNRKNGGSGLGLNIIYNLITSKLKGSIFCDSKIGEGVKFKITIPII